MTAPRPLYALPERPGDVLDANGIDVIDFHSSFVNDRNRVRSSMKEQVAEMLMTNIRNLWTSEAWRHYRHGLGEFEWREHEFDYFLAAQLISPLEVSMVVKNGSIDSWAELINSTNPGRGQRGKTRRPIGEVADQIRRSIPGGHGDPDVWVKAALVGFGDFHDQAIAKSPKRLREVKKSSLSAVKRPPEVRVQMAVRRDESKTVAQQQAELITAWLGKHPDVLNCVITQFKGGG
jgi:hypothetical protein